MTKQPTVSPLLNDMVLAAGNPPHATVISAGAVIVDNAAGLTVIVLDTDATVLLHASIAVHVSITVPPHEVGDPVHVKRFIAPLIKHQPVRPLLNDMVLAAGTPPHATVISAGVIIVYTAAGF